MAAIEMEKVVRALPELLAISRRVWIDCDEEADVLPGHRWDAELASGGVWGPSRRSGIL